MLFFRTFAPFALFLAALLTLPPDSAIPGAIWALATLNLLWQLGGKK